MVSKDAFRSRRETESACSYLKRPENPSTLDKNAGGNDRRRRFAKAGETVWFRSKGSSEKWQRVGSFLSWQ